MSSRQKNVGPAIILGVILFELGAGLGLGILLGNLLLSMNLGG